jgi:cellulose synthase/poly-beta-1,6-N-acetylglucosamine synthase-like glycosyltransferase
MSAWDLLSSLDLVSLIALFWYAVLFEFPRYAIGAVLVCFAARCAPPTNIDFSFSVLLVGHNEAKCLRKAVEALREQTIVKACGRMQIVVVDDGSTDGMADIARELQCEGNVHAVFSTHYRGGKSAGVNLGLSACTGDIVIIVDVDTTFDNDAFAIILGYFADPQVGAVSGSLGVRNTFANLITRDQAIEYAIGLMLGRRIADTLGLLTIVSGAFGAFRRSAIESIGRQDVEVGEDADLTLKLRRAGWRIRFASDAIGLTDVPETVTALIAQRLRWDRGLITIWGRKYRGTFNPWQSTFRLVDVLALADVMVFQVVLALAFPAYIVWLWYYFDEFALTIMGATLGAYFILDLLTFAIAATSGLAHPFRLLPYLPFYTVMQITLMRVIRLIAIVQELVFFSSYRDPYVPARVLKQVGSR